MKKSKRQNLLLYIPSRINDRKNRMDLPLTDEIRATVKKVGNGLSKRLFSYEGYLQFVLSTINNDRCDLLIHEN